MNRTVGQNEAHATSVVGPRQEGYGQPSAQEYDLLLNTARKMKSFYADVRIVARPEFTYGEVQGLTPPGGIMGDEWHSIGYVDDLLYRWKIRPYPSEQRGGTLDILRRANAYSKLLELLRGIVADEDARSHGARV